MDLKQLKLGVIRLAEERDIPREQVIDIIENAVASAYKKDFGAKGQNIEAKINFETGECKFWQVKEVISKDMILSEEEAEILKEGEELEQRKVRFNPERHILFEEAQKDSSDIKVGDEVRIPLQSHHNYGRIAAQTAKQVILQRLKEAERDMLFNEYKDKEGGIISGTVQRVAGDKVFFDLGKVLGILAKEEQTPGEFYEIGERFKLYLLSVNEGTKGPIIELSRAFPKFVSKLFEIEVPEISGGEVEIKSIAREAGSRTKVAVQSHEEDIDPIGAAIGQRGSRVSAVISELGGEKIDIVEYSDDPEEYIKNALSPAKVFEVEIKAKNKAICTVPEDQLSLAIGKEGQNVRLAAKLTGWKIDIKPIEERGGESKEDSEDSSLSEDSQDSSLSDLGSLSDSDDSDPEEESLPGGAEDKKGKKKKPEKEDGGRD